MCRYLFSRCADCWKTDELGCCPMFCAAANNHVEVVEWLFHHGGAKDDVRKPNMSGNSPLFMALYNNYVEVGKRLILNGALFSRYNGVVIDARIMRNDLRPVSGIVWNDDKRLSLLSWAQDAVTTHENVIFILKGTIVSSSYKTTTSKRIKLSPPLGIFNGKSGILELIAEYCGNPKVRDLRIFRQLIHLLPAFIEDIPYTPFEEDYVDY